MLSGENTQSYVEEYSVGSGDKYSVHGWITKLWDMFHGGELAGLQHIKDG